MRGRTIRRLRANCEAEEVCCAQQQGGSRRVCCSLTGTLELSEEKRKFLGLGVDPTQKQSITYQAPPTLAPTPCLIKLMCEIQVKKESMEVKQDQVMRTLVREENHRSCKRLEGRNHACLHPAPSQTQIGSSGGTRGFSPAPSSGVLSLPSAHQKASGGAQAATPDP